MAEKYKRVFVLLEMETTLKAKEALPASSHSGAAVKSLAHQAVEAAEKLTAKGQVYDRALQHVTEAQAHFATAKRELNEALAELWRATGSDQPPLQMGTAE